MCGIAAAVGNHSGEQRRLLEKMVSSIAHRGPDDQGFFASGGVHLGMCRLSIIDLTGGHQPISNEDGQVTVVCNGEIYNHEDLRKLLLKRGHRFKTRSDVEVIVHLYEEKGMDLLGDLRGMFAFTLWDNRKKRLFAARDRMGIKPLFYAQSGGVLLLSSEIKALLRSARVSKEMDWRGLNQYLSFGYIRAPYSIYKEIKKLRPGHYLLWENGKLREERYWRVQFEPKPEISENQWSDEFMEVFREAVKLHMMSDVPIGAFLSGGVDSGLVVALMSELTNGSVNTFTMGFGGHTGGYLDERPYARLIAERYGTNHTEYEIMPRIDEILDFVVKTFDEPFADDSVIPSYTICKLAREKVKVAMTGLGGDELFGGYQRYLGLKLSRTYDRLPAVLKRYLIEPAINALPERRDGHYTVNHLKRFVRSAGLRPPQRYIEYLTCHNWEAKRSLLKPEAFDELLKKQGEEKDEIYFEAGESREYLDRALNHDIHTYLPEDILALTDRLSMHHSLELRVPFLDHRVVEFCARMPASLKIRFWKKKYLLKKAAKPYLPSTVLTHRKQGFASPMAQWLRGDLKDFLMESLSPRRLSKHGLFNEGYVQRLLSDHLERKELNDKPLFNLLMFQKWYESFAE